MSAVCPGSHWGAGVAAKSRGIPMLLSRARLLQQVGTSHAAIDIGTPVHK